jgi:predicted ATP-grasp superfamily ATP-dependent carboligase
MAEPDLLIVGASARAAAFSAARAGFRPYWIDQFGDADLRGRFPGRAVAPERYPAGMLSLLEAAPHAPFLYTGALENHADFLRRAAQRRPLLGNDAGTCGQVRDPRRLFACLQDAGIDAPRVIEGAAGAVRPGRWLLKSQRSAGGLGVSEFDARAAVPPGHYLQQFVEGESRSGVFVGNGADAVLLGVTRQLVGLRELNAGPFMYCGSIGPLRLQDAERRQWQVAGSALARGFGLRGLFGVDAIVVDGTVRPVEINPRYTASVEVIEQAIGIPAIRFHCDAFTGVLPPVVVERLLVPVGKCYLFAPRAFAVDAIDSLRDYSGNGLLQLADLPNPGARIAPGAPLLSVLASAGDNETCGALLLRHAASVMKLLNA